MTIRPSLMVGPLAVHAGEKRSGFIEVPAGVDEGTTIPVTVIAGKRPGPVLALVAGIHGSEPSPILALQRVRSTVDPAMLSGTVILVQIANLPSFAHRTIYRGPFDRKNLNRMFPGRADGTASERIAHAITTEVIDRCEFLVDMHSGDGNEDLRPYSYWNQLGVDVSVDRTAREMALAFGLDHIVIDRGRPRDLRATIFCSNTAHARGKPAVTTEAGGLGVPTEDAIELNFSGALRVMRYLRMIPGDAESVASPIWLEPSEVLTSPGTGIWLPAVQADSKVKAGTLLGTLTDYFGDPVAEVRSPMDGVITYVVASPAMTEGEPVAMVAQMTTAPAS
jgi:predicted deacylase